MTDVDLALCREIAGLLKWSYYDNAGDADGPFIKGDDDYFTYFVQDPEGVWAFIRAVEGTLTEEQQVRYGARLCWYVDDSDAGSNYAFRIATAPAPVRLAALKEVLSGRRSDGSIGTIS